jgi:FtsX-like permease family
MHRRPCLLELFSISRGQAAEQPFLSAECQRPSLRCKPDRSLRCPVARSLQGGFVHRRPRDFDQRPSIHGRRHRPKKFAGIFGGVAEAAWIPLSGLRGLSTDSPPDPLLHFGLQVAVRLRPGVNDASAAAELHALAHAFALQQHADNGGRWDWNLRDAAHFQRGLFNMVGSLLPVLLGASGLLMVLVCINIASLLGQHAARRRREVAIRSALGATPTRIRAQVLAETRLLALGGGLVGWAASIGMARGLYVLLPNYGVPPAFNLRSDTRVLFFVTAVTVAVTLACGIYPVRQSRRVSQNEALHEGGATVAGSSRNGFGRRIMLGLQLGICFVVLVCCGLLTRTALNIANRTTGFDPPSA